MELNITRFYNTTCPRDYFASIAGPDTWRAACDDSHDYMMLDTADKLQAMREHVAGFGAWTDEEIASWTDVELNALLIQMIAGDIRESCLADGGSWAMYYEEAEQGIVSGNLFSDDAGQVYYTIED